MVQSISFHQMRSCKINNDRAIEKKKTLERKKQREEKRLAREENMGDEEDPTLCLCPRTPYESAAKPSMTQANDST